MFKGRAITLHCWSGEKFLSAMVEEETWQPAEHWHRLERFPLHDTNPQRLSTFLLVLGRTPSVIMAIRKKKKKKKLVSLFSEHSFFLSYTH